MEQHTYCRFLLEMLEYLYQFPPHAVIWRLCLSHGDDAW